MSRAVYGWHADTDSLRTLQLEGVTAYGTSWRGSVVSGVPVQQLTSADLKRLGALNVADALRYLSGVQVRDYGGVGGLKTVSLRGLGAQHTGVSYDGVPVGDCQSGQVDLSRYATDNIASVVVTIGQTDNIFCSARQLASAGTINIVTTQQTDATDPLRLTAQATAGSYGLVAPSVALSTRVSGKTFVTTHAAYQRADGDYHFELRNGNRLISERRLNSDIESGRAEVNLVHTPDDRQTLRLKTYFYASERGLPGSVVYDNTYAAGRLTDQNCFAQATYENRLSDLISVKGAAKANYVYNRTEDVLAGGPTEDTFRQRELYATATVLLQPTPTLSLSAAQDYQHNHLSTSLVNCPYPTRNTWLSALSASWQTRRLGTTASMLYTDIHESVRTGTSAQNCRRLSPSLNIVWQPTDAQFRLRASVKDIFRSPTLNDLYYTLVGNTQLRPEKTLQTNIGMTWFAERIARNTSMTLTLDAWHGHVKDKIVAVPQMFIWKMQNLGKASIDGLDATLSANTRPAEGWSIALTAAYTYMKAIDKTDPQGSTYRHQIAYTPKNNLSTSLVVDTPWLEIAYNYLFTDTRYQSNYNSQANKMATINEHNISMSRAFSWRRQQLRIQFDALNLGGKNHEIIRFYPMPGRNYRMTITYKY